MGTYINLSIIPNSISILDWDQVYDESLKLVNAFPFADVVEREFFGYELPIYVKAFEKIGQERHWVIRGDLQSKRFAENFTLYRDISHYQSAKLESNQKDILFEEDRLQTDVFNSKTQGYEYHLFILAIAMLIESRLPNKSLVSGNIDYNQCVKAKQWADQYLSSPIEIPVRVDVDKLLSRTTHLNNEMEQVQFINKWMIADQEEKFKIIYTCLSRTTFLDWLGNELKAYSSPNQLGALKLLIYFINTTADLNNLLDIICKPKYGPQFSDSEVIRAIARTWVCLPREKFSFLDLFAKVSGHPEIVEWQFGSVMLDMMFAGREIKTYIPLTDAVKILGEYLPDSASAIESLLKQEISKIEEQLLAFNNQIRPALEISEASTEDKMYLADEDAFLYFDGDTIILTDEQELTLKAIAYSIKTFLNREGEGALKEFISVPLEKLKLILAAFVNEKYNMILTEQAWQWIDRTDDPLLVQVLLVKVIIDDANDLKYVRSHSDIRKAMFENKLLTQRIVQYINDEAIMTEIRKYVSQTD
ncbi:hypothetical protein Q73_01295 [Bacillus coahuilensis m2-6]|uniref:hypothetical protein n=1 Tax=Bacillus coahuilensis TaxID=408580 RepID=UPI0007501A21|nr:hypothetical protein [Bacillus coahuilensis]KUP09891.1 hypothetical protein Q73_01295 [Bacillus coahuilensis m2-6]